MHPDTLPSTISTLKQCTIYSWERALMCWLWQLQWILYPRYRMFVRKIKHLPGPCTQTLYTVEIYNIVLRAEQTFDGKQNIEYSSIPPYTIYPHSHCLQKQISVLSPGVVQPMNKVVGWRSLSWYQLSPHAHVPTYYFGYQYTLQDGDVRLHWDGQYELLYIILMKAKCLLLRKMTFKFLEQCSYMWTLLTHYSNVNNQDNYIEVK